MLFKQKSRMQMRENQYQFFFAINAKDAIQIIKQHPNVNVEVTDNNMPETDALTLLGRLHEISPLIKAVIVSAYGDMDNIRMAMNRGAFDFLCKPINFEDLETTMLKTIKHVSQLQDTLQAIKENNILRMYVD